MFYMFKIKELIYWANLIYLLILITSQECVANVVTQSFKMPAEGETHVATWMAYGATVDAWGTNGSYGASRLIARKDIIRIAANLARFEPVKILINDYDLDEAEQFLSEIRNETSSVYTGGKLVPPIEASGKVKFIVQPIDDLWVRDTGPVFVRSLKNVTYGINFNFNGWGQENTSAPGWKKSAQKAANGIEDQTITDDKKVANFIIQKTKVQEVRTWLVMEGGGIEVNGNGTAIFSESCILNDNRNPGKTKKEVEKEMLRLLGIKKAIWLPGVKGMDVTDGHVDFYARFVNDSTVLCTLDNNVKSPDYNVTHQNFNILSDSTDAYGNKIKVIPLLSPNFLKVKEAVIDRNGWKNNQSFFNMRSFAAGYIGFYLANDCIMMANFGDDAADKEAFKLLSELYPNRTVLQITTDGIANGGGTIHCSTQQQIPKNAFSLKTFITSLLTCVFYCIHYRSLV